MAAPFKRICLRASKSTALTQQWRPITTTPSRTAAPTPSDALSASDPNLDQLSRQPGVQYSLSTEPDKDLSKYNPTDLSSLGHRELEQHRELREMVRLAAWEMPLLASLSTPYTPPAKTDVLRWRYTTYMGEAHPASRKVVVTFNPHDLPDLTPEQVQKMLKLAGARWNPSKQEIKMSCESFETQAQNKRFLATTINALVAEAADPETDDFADVPLDLRHHRPKPKHKFPQEWVMTNERRMQLEGERRTLRLAEARVVNAEKLVDGTGILAQAVDDAQKKKEADEKAALIEASIPMSAAKSAAKTGRRR